MGNQGKMKSYSKVCKEVQNDEKYSEYAILGFYFPKQKTCAQRCGRINLERMAIAETQNYRECMETKKAIFRNSKERIPSLSSSSQL